MSKDSIKNRIMVPFLSIILSSLLLSLILFNFIIGAHIKNEAKKELINTIIATEKIINMEYHTPDDFTGSKFIRQLQFLLNSFNSINETKFMIISGNYTLLFPSEITENSDVSYIRKKILPTLKLNEDKLQSRKIFTFSTNSTKYLSIAYPLILVSGNTTISGYIVYYTNMSKTENILNAANIILIFILLAAAIIVFFTSLIVSDRITKPIKALCAYAKTIGDRNFKTHSFEKFGGEIEELAQSMNAMAVRLSDYDKAQKTFLQNASHELRTPLMSIQGYAEGIKYGVFDDIDKASDTIISESKRLTSLVEELLYLSRLDALSDSYEPEKIDLSDFLNECISRMQGLALKENVMLIYEKPEQSVCIMADSDKISRAIINILSNCIRYAKTKTIIQLSADDKNARLRIEDDGRGFSQEDLNNLFVRFYKGEGGNFGLGLSISKTIISRHGGEIIAKNSDNGAMFLITLPLAKE